ncbi:MAG: 4Fe-4S binding protein [Bacteroidetes bacterium]|nr:4Fe-4S binding protein [Bacteroidota bacterium]MCL6099339.1 4Fe-4S binding protein [Bacteroidota bacterium]
MNTPILRKVRIVVSLVFLIATTFLLIDFYGYITALFKNDILYLQFVPSLLKFITILSISTSGFLIVILLTVLFGRIYCSTICPLGILQDIVNYFARKFRKKNRFEFLKEQKILRLSLLILSAIVFVFGSSVVINLLDPYSIYGRIAGNFFKPVLVGVNNLVSKTLEIFKVYSVYYYDIKAFNAIPFIITAAFFVLVVVMAWMKGRLYCNTVCPVGTLLGYISRISVFKILIKDEDCISCSLCTQECKSGCIDSDNKTVDMSRCVMCFDCLSLCPTDGITFSYSYKKRSNENIPVEQSKRDFFTKTLLYFISVTAIGAQVQKKIIVTKPSTKAIFKQSAVSPPGSISVERFNSKCTACNLCVVSCPTQVLQPSFLEYGFLGIMQPWMDNAVGFCNFECTICADVCPTGAILPIPLEKKKLTQIGKAKFVKDNCVVNTQKTDCGACSEHCPTKAVHMIPFEGKLLIPETRDDYCIGCGACEFACPTFPYKSIYVDGNRTHQSAKKNVEEKKLEKVNLKEDFPF